MGSRLNYLDTQSSRQRRHIHSHTHTPTHTHKHPFLFGILPCLPHCSSECLTPPLCYALHVSISFLIHSSLFFPYLKFSSLFPHNNISFLPLCCGSFSFVVALISPNTVVFILALLALSSVVICLTFSPCPFLLSYVLRCLYSLFTSLCIAPWSPSSSIRSPCSLPLFSTF